MLYVLLLKRLLGVNMKDKVIVPSWMWTSRYESDYYLAEFNGFTFIWEVRGKSLKSIMSYPT